MSQRRGRRVEQKAEEQVGHEELKKCDEEQKEEEKLLPNCQICCEKINMNSYLKCPECDIEWCTLCIKRWIRTNNYCTNCKKRIELKNLRPNFGVLRLLENFKQYVNERNNTKTTNELAQEISEVLTCKEHNQETTLFCNDCKLIICSKCLKTGNHDGHNITGDIIESLNKIKDKMRSIIDVIKSTSSIIENISFAKRFIRLRDSNQDNYESKFLIYNLFLKKATIVNQNLDKVLSKLEIYTVGKNEELIENYSNIEDTIEESESLIDESDELVNLNIFVKIHILDCIPFKSFEEEFSISLNNLNHNASEKIVMINDNAYMITFIKLANTGKHKIEFTWMNRPDKWSFDLKVDLYCMTQQNSYILLNDDPVIVTPSRPSRTLHTLRINELLPNHYKLPSDSDSNDFSSEEDEQPNDIKLTFKINVGQIDYGMRESIDADPFNIYQNHIHNQLYE